jgi:hypothetical protein
MKDRPVDLSPLRTPPPLEERDYAAVRGRVMAEIRRREPARWPWLLPLAAALLLMFVFVGRKAEERAPLPPEPIPLVMAAPKPVAATPQVVIPAEAVEAPRPSPVRVVSSHPRPSAEAPPMTIHMQTADPDVRIIWIVKENS